MKRVLRVAVPALLAMILVIVVVYGTGLGQGSGGGGGGGPQIGTCPLLRTDPFGNPLFPPFSEYIDPLMGPGEETFGPVDIFKTGLPCCGTVDFSTNPPTITSTVDADCITETCPAGTTNLTNTPDDPNDPWNPYFGFNCPRLCQDLFITFETGGAVKNCDPTSTTFPFGTSNFALTVTGSNAGG